MARIEIPVEMEARMTEQAQKLQISMDEYLLHFLEFFDEYLEDQEDYLLASAAMERVEKGIEKTIPFEDVLKKLGLDATSLEDKKP